MSLPTDSAQWEPGYTDDPYPYLAALRAGAAARKVVIEGLAVWVVTRYEEVRRGLNDPTLSTDARHANPVTRSVPWAGAVQSGVARHMLRIDPPEHTRLRRLVSRAFTPRRIERLRPRISELCDGLLSAFVDRGSADLMAEFAGPLPLNVIGELFGVPEREQVALLRWVNVYAEFDKGDAGRIHEALANIRECLVGLVADARRRAGSKAGSAEDGTVLDALVAARDEEGRLTEDELIGMAFLILVAGFETSVNLIANGTVLLMREPDRMAAVRSDPAALTSAIEEFLRYESPVKITPAIRYATVETVVGDTVIPAGDPVLFHLGSANRDPARFPAADRFDLARGDAGHLAFGQGPHYCLGAPLARLEAEIAFRALLAACPDLRLAVPPESLRWRSSRAIRGLRELPVAFTPRPVT